MAYLIIAALVFFLCFLVDKGFAKLFRSRKEHRSGLAVRQQKKYALFSLFLCILGVLGFSVGVTQSLALAIGGVVVLLMGASMAVYYLTFGIFYDQDGFLQSSFGKKSAAYAFGNIRTQALYQIQGGRILVELHMADGSAVSVDTAMAGACDFLDYAFYRWCEQTGRDPENCTFHDPSNSLWFPTEEEA